MAILGVNYYLAQNYDYLGNYDTAMMVVTESIQHTPMLIEFYVLKDKFSSITTKSTRQ